MKYCLIGGKLSHSFSAQIHERNGFDYTLKELDPSALDEFLRECGVDGFNVTIPYKEKVIPYLDEIAEDAKSMGSVNTVSVKNGKKYGYNTDVTGLDYMIKRKVYSLRDKVTLILGTGGAAKTVAYLAKKNGAKEVVFCSRTGETNYENVYEKAARAEVVFNATPVGTFPNVKVSPIDLSKFACLEAAFDLVYNPLRTEFVMQAQSLGVIVSDGLPMLVKQAVEAERIWRGGEFDDNTEEILTSILKEKTNIVLCGMPSCGKSSVAKLLASTLNRPFFDTDEEIAKKYAKSAEEIILEEGERAFRDKESAAIDDLSLVTGAVIAVGGGAVLREENVKNLKRNGIIVKIERDISLLSEDGRPLSKKNGIKKLYEERNPIYDRAKDYVCENNGDIASCVKGVLKVYEDSCS